MNRRRLAAVVVAVAIGLAVGVELVREGGSGHRELHAQPDAIAARLPPLSPAPRAGPDAPAVAGAPPASPAPAAAARGSAGAVPPNAKQGASPGSLTTGAMAAGAEPPLFAADRDGIREGMELARQDIDVCYREWLKVSPKIEGKARVHFVISAANGRPGEVSLDSGLHQTALEGCIVSAVQDLHFERPGSDLTVNFPYAFASAP